MNLSRAVLDGSHSLCCLYHGSGYFDVISPFLWAGAVFTLFVQFAYNGSMIKAYSELVEFIASGTTPQAVCDYSASDETRTLVADLIHREKTTGLNEEEQSELDHFMKIEHLMRLAKARAHAILGE